MAYESSPTRASSSSSSSPLQNKLNFVQVKEEASGERREGDHCLLLQQQQQNLCWFNNEHTDLATSPEGGPSSVEVQADLSESPRSVGSASSHLDDFNNESLSSPLNRVAEEPGAAGEDLDIMGIANTWNDDDPFGSDSAVPARSVDLSCLSNLGQTANPSGQYWPSPTPLFPPSLDLFEEDRESVCELLGDVPASSTSTPGVCGLRNLGNTCFMNAGLQCLINTPPLLNYFNSNAMDVGCTGVHLTAQFASFLLKMWSGGYSTLRPSDFKHALSLYHPQFKDYRQHDCQEFLAVLLDSLHEHLSQMGQDDGEDDDNGTKPQTIARSTSIATKAGIASGPTSSTEHCCLQLPELGTEEPMELLYESSRSSQLSSPRSSSDSVETSSCTSSSGSSSGNIRAKAAAMSLRSLPIPEEMKQPPSYPFVTVPSPSHDGSATDLLFRGSSSSPRHCSLVVERNMLNPSPDPAVLEKNLLSEISSMMKDSKTANVNISARSGEESTANNEICFDSGKFETDPAKPRAAVASTLLRNSTSDQQASNIGRVKNTNVLKEAAKRLSEDQNLTLFSNCQVQDDQTLLLPASRNNNDNSMSSKKARYENDQHLPREPSSSWDSLGEGVSNKPDKGEELLPPKGHHLASMLPIRESVVTRTFQGQFRSTVVCCTCKHVSITYEPFMYLSVPLPRALERTIEVIFIPESGYANPSQHLLVLQQYDEVAKLRQLLAKRLELSQKQGDQLVLAEVAMNRAIVRYLEDKMLLRHLVDGPNRVVYAFAVPRPDSSLNAPILSSDCSSSSESVAMQVEQPSNCDPLKTEQEKTSWKVEAQHSWKTCAICLEEMPDSDLRKHTSCSCLLCQSCIEASCRHHGSSAGGSQDDDKYLQCPVCSMVVKPDVEFAPLNKLHEYTPVIRLLNIPILLRRPATLGGPKKTNNNSGSGGGQLVSHPRLLQLPNLISPRGLYDLIRQLYPAVVAFELCLVDSQVLHVVHYSACLN